MPKTQRQIEASLRLLAQHVRRGLAQLHPATPKEIEAARAGVRRQWEHAQQTAQRRLKAKTVARQRVTTLAPGPAQEIPRPRSQSHGHSH